MGCRGFEGNESGKHHFLDIGVAYKRAVLNAISYLFKFGYTKEQANLLSCCPCEGRISGIVDIPNACATFAIPVAIFEQDIRPKRDGPPRSSYLVLHGDVPKCSYDGSLPKSCDFMRHGGDTVLLHNKYQINRVSKQTLCYLDYY
ncbi:hypothetical protein KP509_14G081000 [Ceratopteris richardii]|uniref:Uncharacterized protein n=1 Tax=Ceratopteris richardii TaxID=49495 RepID=A0A8T2T9M3_CERRI|nr:hypothetical protein KP509_14G081000 [Ceratopteris richardii]